ncbi:MAG: hypothetical protein E6960_12260 [Clostridium sp.]|uniref:hypothetical protein n=1 Tax=Clostridium sp. TaxID=1506 RepID=UPI002904C6DA|nr:hypothetical protein [Clostridium sp.]MDU1279242.1 hypothetical protein [Clostridium sp.]
MSKEITMSIPQFLAYERGEKSIKDIEIENGLESIATKIMNNNRIRKMVVFTIASLNYMNTVLADTSEAVARINIAGNTFLTIFQSIGYWLCLIGCIMEILKSVMNGSSKDVGKVMLKYLLIFAALYLMPFAFNLVKEIFA